MIVAFVIHIHPLSSPLLLRISPHTFAFIPIQPMSLSNRNRNNSKAFHLILPCVAPFCKGMHYHKTGVPWHMNSTFIIFLYLHLSLIFLLKCPILQVFSAFSGFCISGVSSQIFPYFLVLFPAILVNLLVNKCSVPTGYFRLLLLEAALPVRHRTAHGCKHSALR